MTPPAAPSPPAGPWAALDPGRSKCGLVLSDPEGRQIVAAAVLPPEACWQRLQDWHGRPGPEGPEALGRPTGLAGVVVGDGTGSGPWRERLRELGVPVVSEPEAGTTLAARQRYWQLHPPGPLRRLIPPGLRQPPRDWDDVVAQLLLERHLGRTLSRLPEALERA
ncbi:resolvase [Vulcanococcus limneticus]|uniref:resolvase n=1 Tax=Vulcanococcus limneticus TaxID=2170428 RepID=UPI00398BF7EA